MEGRRLVLVGRDPAELNALKTSLVPRGYTVAITAPGEGVWRAF